MKTVATSGSAAPGRLELVRAFVNTLDVESGEDVLSSPAALVAWFRERDLLAAPAVARTADLDRARAVREAVRALLVANNGGAMDVDAPPILEAAARAAKLELHFAPGGTADLRPGTSGVSGALGGLLAIVSDSMAAGTWSRLKACRAESCRWAFYDRAPNRSRAWCSMAVCGNRTKARAYRARRAAL